ncbi:hypothetical protein SERLA73DRAFT_183503 [Serpula lacrymans var. lacrymans S7.3]|uniref:Uncharacterized protein n=2 Tax=Serpula lacrymans var. lacrymans TaxID=341189 RepID=F8Q000_SERL3|nr:uncharacterized protein SERLADRAFT_470720 [Serpula lacrymans var. lacrymans S7.9]EGN98472.1 hypothetical protein SERLA73DRAFT_183503 [Serpula lacrymans var. lacrymans S7.3]EGO24051.1 hypothetical protein SERLADRAFT_470720 [Serpula lacrymans var. lacrymans S7.9]
MAVHSQNTAPAMTLTPHDIGHLCSLPKLITDEPRVGCRLLPSSEELPAPSCPINVNGSKTRPSSCLLEN